MITFYSLNKWKFPHWLLSMNKIEYNMRFTFFSRFSSKHTGPSDRQITIFHEYSKYFKWTVHYTRYSSSVNYAVVAADAADRTYINVFFSLLLSASHWPNVTSILFIVMSFYATVSNSLLHLFIYLLLLICMIIDIIEIYGHWIWYIYKPFGGLWAVCVCLCVYVQCLTCIRYTGIRYIFCVRVYCFLYIFAIESTRVWFWFGLVWYDMLGEQHKRRCRQMELQ